MEEKKCPNTNCNHRWIPKMINRDPLQCPKCRKRLRWPPKEEAPINSPPEDSSYTEVVEY